jgi:hypothetical protein
MGIYFQTKGRPLSIREVEFQGISLFCIDFDEESKAQPPKDMPKPKAITSTAILNTKQFRKLKQTIQNHGDSLETIHSLLIKGEIIKDLPYDIAISDITFIGFEVQYLPRKENELFNGSNVEVSILHPEELERKPDSPKKREEFPSRLIELHKYFDGVCQKCGQRCDKRVMHLVEQDTRLVCLDCFRHQIRSTFHVSEKVLDYFMFKTEMKRSEAIEYLTQFSSKYVFVQYEDDFGHRVYWSWDQNEIVEKVLVNQEGSIFEITLRPSKEKPKPCKKKGKVIYIQIRENKYKIIKEDTIHVLEFKIPKTFQRTTPRKEKIAEKIELFSQTGKFNPVVIIKNKGTLYLIDGYTNYIAANQLHIHELEAIFVASVPSEGGKSHAFKSESNGKTVSNS